MMFFPAYFPIFGVFCLVCCISTRVGNGEKPTTESAPTSLLNRALDKLDKARKPSSGITKIGECRELVKTMDTMHDELVEHKVSEANLKCSEAVSEANLKCFEANLKCSVAVSKAVSDENLKCVNQMAAMNVTYASQRKEQDCKYANSEMVAKMFHCALCLRTRMDQLTFWAFLNVQAINVIRQQITQCLGKLRDHRKTELLKIVQQLANVNVEHETLRNAPDTDEEKTSKFEAIKSKFQDLRKQLTDLRIAVPWTSPTVDKYDSLVADSLIELVKAESEDHAFELFTQEGNSWCKRIPTNSPKENKAANTKYESTIAALTKNLTHYMIIENVSTTCGNAIPGGKDFVTALIKSNDYTETVRYQECLWAMHVSTDEVVTTLWDQISKDEDWKKKSRISASMDFCYDFSRLYDFLSQSFMHSVKERLPMKCPLNSTDYYIFVEGLELHDARIKDVAVFITKSWFPDENPKHSVKNP